MHLSLNHKRPVLTPQPLIAIVSVVAALTGPLVDVRIQRGFGTLVGWYTLLPAVLFAAVILAEQFPVHVRLNTKVQMTTVPIFLIAALLSPPMAGMVAGLSMVVGEISVNRHKGNYPSDIATDAARWAIAAFLGSLVVHHVAGWHGLPVGLLFAGVTMWLWDMFSSPATLSPMSGETPRRVISDMIREAGPAEAAQYIVGITATALVLHAAWAAPLLLLPAATIQITTKRSKELNRGTRDLLEGMADTVDLRDPYTGGHSRRVTDFVKGILDQLGKSGPEVDLIITAARLHDIGKIAVPDEVLNKPGKLTDEEWAIMASHPEVGADFLGRHPGFKRGVEIVRHHHEAWDGTGYPHKLKGTAIPFGARVIAVADSFDAMTSDRPYRAGMTAAKAIGILRDGRGTQWDADIVDAFVRTAKTDEANGLRLIHTDRQPVALSA